MTLEADSVALYAQHDADGAHHGDVRKVIDSEQGAITVPTVILAEPDCLLRELIGVDAELDILKTIASRAYSLESFMTANLERCRELISGYRDINLGLVDAAVIATAEWLGFQYILTVDERALRVVHRRNALFTLLLADT